MTELEKLVGAFEDKIRQRALAKDHKSLFDNGREDYRRGVSETLSIFEPILEAVLKMEDHRLIGHSEPDAYTKLGCLTNVATEALKESRKRLQEQYGRDLRPFREEAIERAKLERMEEPWGAANPAFTKTEAVKRLRWWAMQGAMDVNAHEVLGWTQYELDQFHERAVMPTGYET